METQDLFPVPRNSTGTCRIATTAGPNHTLNYCIALFWLVFARAYEKRNRV